MGPGGRRPDTYQYVYPHSYTPHTDTVSHLFLLVLHPGSVLDFLFPPFVSESEETSLSVSAFSLLWADRHTHTHKYSTCTDTQTPAPTETDTHAACLLLLWWLRAVKTSLLSLPLSHQSSLTELVYAGSQRLLSIHPHSLFLSSSFLHPLPYICVS